MIPVLKCTVRNFVRAIFFVAVEVPLSERSVKVPIAFIHILSNIHRKIFPTNN